MEIEFSLDEPSVGSRLESAGCGLLEKATHSLYQQLATVSESVPCGLSPQTVWAQIESLHRAGENPTLVVIGKATYTDWIVTRRGNLRERTGSVEVLADRACGWAEVYILNTQQVRVRYSRPRPIGPRHLSIKEGDFYLGACWDGANSVRFRLRPELVVDNGAKILRLQPRMAKLPIASRL